MGSKKHALAVAVLGVLTAAGMVLGGCSTAQNASPEVPQGALALVAPGEMPARQVVMPGYTVTLPEELARTARFVVNASDEPSEAQWIGDSVDVRSADGDFAVFFVVSCSDDWSPQGALYSRKLGPSSAVEGASVYVCQARTDRWGADVDDALDEYASYVELTGADERAQTFETPYCALQLPDNLARSCAIVYDDYARAEEGEPGETGHATGVFDVRTGDNLFFVACGTESFGPEEGDPRGMKLGEPSQLPGSNVYVGQLMFDPAGGTTDPRAEEYASFVTVR